MAEAAYAGTRGECQMDSKANTKSGLRRTWDRLRPGMRTRGIPSEDAKALGEGPIPDVGGLPS
jgi:hypothetical protein